MEPLLKGAMGDSIGGLYGNVGGSWKATELTVDGTFHQSYERL